MIYSAIIPKLSAVQGTGLEGSSCCLRRGWEGIMAEGVCLVQAGGPNTIFGSVCEVGDDVFGRGAARRGAVRSGRGAEPLCGKGPGRTPGRGRGLSPRPGHHGTWFLDPSGPVAGEEAVSGPGHSGRDRASPAFSSRRGGADPWVCDEGELGIMGRRPERYAPAADLGR